MKVYGGVDVYIHIFLNLGPAAPAALPPGKEPPVPFGKDVEWAPQPARTTWKRENSWSYRDSNSYLCVVQAVASRYTDWANPTPRLTIVPVI
jgi:hypothetical protein